MRGGSKTASWDTPALREKGGSKEELERKDCEEGNPESGVQEIS